MYYSSAIPTPTIHFSMIPTYLVSFTYNNLVFLLGTPKWITYTKGTCNFFMNIVEIRFSFYPVLLHIFLGNSTTSPSFCSLFPSLTHSPLLSRCLLVSGVRSKPEFADISSLCVLISRVGKQKKESSAHHTYKTEIKIKTFLVSDVIVYT